ncbi:putative pantothenate transporter [Leucosporidium creatinivorum]|uniref:Putative pantothenate transporter n=1 Tax=Leucosporidium creatinivorum TaxID=106004 RepID=A0A1Y2F4V1_9BASI|nr:putative pantothenate transporter [Leucosporidium creatinivorum]
MSSNTSLKGEEGVQSVPKRDADVLIEDLAAQGHGLPFNLESLDPKAEARLTRKIDFHIVPVVALLYLFCFIDRANIGNARLAGLERDLGMKGYDYNVALSCFYVSYIVFEIPSNIAAKIIGPGRWLPLLTVAFGLLSMCTAWVESFGSLIAVRFLLGAFEAGLLPGIAFYMSRFYRKNELVFRLSLYFVTAPLAGAFGGLLASGILKLPPIGNIHSWKLIFFIEGIITTGLGIIAYFILTDRPETASWLSEDEKRLAEARIKSENAGSVVAVEKLKAQTVWSGIFSINTWLLAFQFLWVNVTVQGISVFMPTIISALYPTESVIARQLKTVPPYVVGAAVNILIPYMAFKTKRRCYAMFAAAPLAIIGFAIFIGSNSNTAKYIATFFVTSGAFPFGALCTGAASANASPDGARAAAIGTVVMIGNIGGLISTWTFTPNYAPRYIPGNAVNLTGGILIFLLTGVMLFYQMWENKQREKGKRDHRLEGLSHEEQALLGHKHPAFRYSY